MEHLEILVEEPSMETALLALVPRILGPGQSFAVHPHEGKNDLLKKLEPRLRSYRRWLPGSYGIVVILDEDRQDCKKLKQCLEDVARSCGFMTRSQNRSSFQVVNWLAIEELEAWYLGDPDALDAAFPGTRRVLQSRRKMRDPDAIKGGTWEALERVLQDAGYHPGGLQKIAAARAIAPHLNPNRNLSRSFCGFVRALRGTRQMEGGS